MVVSLKTLLASVRLLLAGSVVVLGPLICYCTTRYSPAFFGLAHVWHNTILYLLGVKVRYSGAKHVPGALMVGNHVSWADPLVLGSRWPVVFLARREVAGWPILGRMFRVSGTLFIERGKGAAAARTQVSNLLSKNQSVAIFPEGKTSLGESVRRFQPRLFQAAVDAQQPVQAFCLQYIDADGSLAKHLSYANVSLVGGLWRTVVGSRVTALLQVSEPLPATSRQDSANAAHAWVEARLCAGYFP